jgi:hypothetical protein
MEGATTNSEDYAIRFGGIWLEFHERIVAAESTLNTALAERDAARAERDAIHSHKIELEEKFKRSIASLTRTETDHLEARQIMDQVREEHADLSRRCLAAEAHTEWLEDKLKQLKVNNSIKDEEVQAVMFRVEKLKAALCERESTMEGLQKVIADRDAEIATCRNTIRSRDEEMLVLTRSAHSKDKQIALLVKERNALQEDLQKTQRSLALLRRTESTVKRKMTSDKTTTVDSTPAQAHTPQRAGKTPQTGTALRDGSISTPMVIASPDKSSNATTDTPRSAPATSAIGSVLRRYKASRAQGPGKQSASSASQDDCSSSVLLEDILQSVLEPSSATASASTRVALPQSDPDSTTTTATAAYTTYHAAQQRAHSSGVNSAAELLLDDADLDFISSVLDQSSEQSTPLDSTAPGAGVVTPVCAQSKSRRRILSPAASKIGVSEGGTSVFDATVQKMLFGGSLPLPTSSAQAGNHSTTTSTTLAATPVSSADSTVADATPATAMVTLTPNSDGSAATQADFPPVHMTSKINTSGAGDATTQQLAASLSREKDYKAALYLLQEEVRLLRAQVAQHDAAKRVIRMSHNTPKGAGARKTTASLALTPAGSASRSAVEKPGGCVRKLLFPAHA